VVKGKIHTVTVSAENRKIPWEKEQKMTHKKECDAVVVQTGEHAMKSKTSLEYPFKTTAD
jgi:hypothetical protein